MKKMLENKKLTVLYVVIALLVISGCVLYYLFDRHIICVHDYTEPTCEEPAYCIYCGLVEQDHLGHLVADWEVDKEPTCAEQGARHGACTRCAKVLYEKLDTYDHTEGDWDISKEAVINSDGTVTPGTETNYCAKCGKGFKDREYTIELTTEQKNVLARLADLQDFLHIGPSYMREWLTRDGYTKESVDFAFKYCGLNWDEESVLRLEVLKNEDGYSKRECERILKSEGYTNKQVESAMNHYDE